MSAQNTCNICGKFFSTNANYKYHLNRKTPCVIASEVSVKLPVELKFQCNRCDARFKSKHQLIYHLNRKFPCELKNPHPDEIELQALFEKLKQENEDLKTKNELLQNNPSSTVDNRNSHNSNTLNSNSIKNNMVNSHNNNVTINVYGKENLSHITDEMYKSCFKVVKRSVEKFFKMKHFSKKMPENHNLYISNMRDAYMMVYKAGRWDIVNKANTLNQMYVDAKEDLSKAFDKMREEGTLDANLERMFSWFVDDSIEEADEDELKRISCDFMACFAYNNRKYPMEMKILMDKPFDFIKKIKNKK